MIRRVAPCVVAVLALATGCGRGDGGAPESSPVTPGTDPPVASLTKTADILVQTAVRVIAARARGEALANLSNDVVHVRSDGAIEVELHASQLVGDAQLNDLRRLGVEVVTSVTTPSVPGQPPTTVVQAWVPADRLPLVGGLAWIASITPPAYGRTDRGG